MRLFKMSVAGQVYVTEAVDETGAHAAILKASGVDFIKHPVVEPVVDGENLEDAILVGAAVGEKLPDVADRGTVEPWSRPAAYSPFAYGQSRSEAAEPAEYGPVNQSEPDPPVEEKQKPNPESSEYFKPPE